MNAEVVKIFPVRWDSYFKCFQVKFRCRCPKCLRISKHAEGWCGLPNVFKIKGSRTCDWCGHHYEYEWEQK